MTKKYIFLAFLYTNTNYYIVQNPFASQMDLVDFHNLDNILFCVLQKNENCTNLE